MSLAMYASDYNNGPNNNPIQKKRENFKNKTLKRRDNHRSNAKVEAMLSKIHDNEDDDDSVLSDYQPLPPPNSAGTERMRQGMRQDPNQGTEHQDTEHQGMEHQGTEHQGMEQGMEERMNAQQNLLNNTPTQQEGFTQLPSEYAKQYYQQYVPYFNQGSDDVTPNGVNKDELLTKLNQIIYLLEEQQNEKTGHVTEELILYTFLGIFMIFIVDSFARVGKYVR